MKKDHDYIEHVGGTPNQHFRIHWGYGKGFGVIVFNTDKSGKISLETEFMTKDFVRDVMNKIIDQAVLED